MNKVCTDCLWKKKRSKVRQRDMQSNEIVYLDCTRCNWTWLEPVYKYNLDKKQNKESKKDETDKCYIERVDWYKTCTYNHSIWAECLLS